MSEPKFFLVAVSGDDYRPSPLALVQLTDYTRSRIQQRRTAYASAQAADAEIYEMYYWDDGTLIFLRNNSDVDDDDPPTDQESAAAAELADLLASEEHEVMALDAPTASVVSAHRRAWVECVQMIVRESGVMWMCYPKHMDGEMRTAEIPWDVLGMPSVGAD